MFNTEFMAMLSRGLQLKREMLITRSIRFLINGKKLPNTNI
jgi:hypothetical protein